jgi:plastocyanin
MQKVMLHHIVFINAGHPGGQPKATTCPGRRGESFWGTGEEHERLILPQGYGYRIDRRDRWRMQTMLMSHNIKPQTLYVRYRYTVVTGRRLWPVRPLWIRANGCTSYPSYSVPGGGGPGSTNVRSYDWRMPLSGRIVAVGAHMHGSAQKMTLTQPDCGDRTLVTNHPRYGFAGDPVYHVRPILHEPGPVATGYMLSESGIPVHKGDVLRVTGYYDDDYPHPQVMAIEHVYVAIDRSVGPGCHTIPADKSYFWTRKRGRLHGPRQAIPFNVYDYRTGRIHTIARPPGRAVFGGDAATVKVADDGFHPANLTVNDDATVTWSWSGYNRHNVYYADGPRELSSASLKAPAKYQVRFDVPGTYKLFCWLHPITMHQIVTVEDGEEAAAAAFGLHPVGALPERTVTPIPPGVDDGYGEGDGLGL